MSTPSFQNHASSVVDKAKRGEVAPNHASWIVGDGTATRMSVVALYDGFTQKDLSDAYPAVVRQSPERYGFVEQELKHPRTGTSETVFVKASSPAFRLEASREMIVKIAKNTMPAMVYESQPQDTYTYMASRAHTKAPEFDFEEPQVHNIKPCAAALLPRAASSAGIPTGFNFNTIPRTATVPTAAAAAGQALPKRSADTSAAAKRTTIDPQTLKTLYGRQTPSIVGTPTKGSAAVKREPGTPLSYTSAIGSRRSPSPASSPASSPRFPSQSPPPMRVGEFDRQAAGPAAAGIGSLNSAIMNGAKRQRVGGVGATIMPRQGSGTESSTTASAPPRGSRLDRAMFLHPLSRAFAGEGSKQDLTNMKRSITLCKDDPASEAKKFFGQLELHQQWFVTAMEVTISRMIDTPIDATKKFVKCLTTDVTLDGITVKAPGIPKKNFAQWCLRNALQHALSQDFQMKFEAFLRHAAPTKVGPPPPTNHNEPELYCDLFTEEDFKSGVCATQFVHIVELFVLTKFTQKGMEKHKDKVATWLSQMSDWLLTLEPEWLEEQVWKSFHTRVHALLWLIGDKPNMHGSRITHVAELDKAKDGLGLAVKAKDSYLAMRMNDAWLLSAGEEVAWPQIEKCMKLLASDAQDDIHTGVTDALSRYPTWQTQVRESCLPVTIQPELIRVFEQKLSTNKLTAQTEAEPQGEDTSTEEDNEALKEILSQMQSAASRFHNSTLLRLLSSLDKFAARWLSGAALLDLLKVLQAAPRVMVVGIAGGQVESYVSSLLPALQASPTGFECKTLAEIQPVVDVMLRLSLEALRVVTTIPTPMITVLLEMNSKVSVQWPSLEDEQEQVEEYKLNLDEAKNNIVVLREFHTLKETVDQYVAMGDVAEARVATPDSVETMKAMLTGKNNLEETIGRFPASFAKLDAEMYDNFKKTLEDHIKQYKDLYVADAVSGLTPKLHALKEVAGGGTGGNSWHADVPKDQPWSQLKEATVNSLQNVDKTKLTEMIRSVAMAYKEIRTRQKLFGDDGGEEIQTAVSECIKLARITLIEYLMLSAIIMVPMNEEAAIEELKTCSQMLSGAKLTSVDIHTAIWESSLKILRRLPLE